MDDGIRVPDDDGLMDGGVDLPDDTGKEIRETLNFICIGAVRSHASQEVLEDIAVNIGRSSDCLEQVPVRVRHA